MKMRPFLFGKRSKFHFKPQISVSELETMFHEIKRLKQKGSDQLAEKIARVDEIISEANWDCYYTVFFVFLTVKDVIRNVENPFQADEIISQSFIVQLPMDQFFSLQIKQ